MEKTLAMIALQRDVGSMDYVDSVLRMEPEGGSNSSDQEQNFAAVNGATPTAAAAVTQPLKTLRTGAVPAEELCFSNERCSKTLLRC